MRALFLSTTIFLFANPLWSQFISASYQTNFGTILEEVDESCMMIAEEKLFVQDDEDDSIRVFSITPPFNLITSFGHPNLADAEDGIATTNNFIFVADTDDDDVEVFDLAPPHNYVGTLGAGLINR